MCDKIYPVYCVDFHHLDQTQKVAGIAVMSKRAGVDICTFLEEISKCVLLCALCHRKVHFGGIPIERPRLINIEKYRDITPRPRNTDTRLKWTGKYELPEWYMEKTNRTLVKHGLPPLGGVGV